MAFTALAATMAVASTPPPVHAQDLFPAFVMSRVCLPYASRTRTFESAIRVAREMEFRRPTGDNRRLDDWATEIEMVSRDGRWRLRIEEGPVTEDGVETYSARCGLSSNNASARELQRVARRILGNSPLWSQPEGEPGRWDRRTASRSHYALRIDVTETPGQRPVLAARGFYY